MSHGTYLFLVDPGSIDPLTKDAAESWFSNAYAHRYCDSNNWFDPLAIARPGERTLSFLKRDDEEPTFEEMVNTAWSIATHDLRLIGGLPAFWLPGSENHVADELNGLIAKGPRYIDHLIRQIVPKRISEAFVPGEQRTHLLRFTEDGHERWKRDSLVEGYKQYNSSYCPPFSHYLCPPESWRLFDLRHDIQEEHLTRMNDAWILAVDIHT